MKQLKLMHYNHWARAPQSPCAIQPACHNHWAHIQRPSSAMREDTMRSLCTVTKSRPHLPQLEKAHKQQQRPRTANKQINEYLLKTNKQRKGQKNCSVYHLDKLYGMHFLWGEMSWKWCTEQFGRKGTRNGWIICRGALIAMIQREVMIWLEEGSENRAKGLPLRATVEVDWT